MVCQNSNWIDCWCHGELTEMQKNDHILGPKSITLIYRAAGKEAIENKSPFRASTTCKEISIF